jgi:hypothetical protein
MKKLSVSVAAALMLGALVVPSASATTDPVYDPGSSVPSRFGFRLTHPGGEALASGFFVEYSVTLNGRAYVKDLADDGLDTNLWVRYGKKNGDSYKEVVATVSGAGVSKPVEWYSPAGMHVDYIGTRVCVGAGEDNCSAWVG